MLKTKLSTKRSRWISGVALVVFLLLALAFPFGPLLPWSPIKLGYRNASYARADVYFDRQQPPTPDFAQVETMMREAERFHGLRFQRRVRVIECKNWADCQRALPWLNTQGLGGITLGTGDVIYLTPKLKEKHLSTTEFLRHELSHAVLCQNTTLYHTFKLNEQPWFYEGLAVSFGQQQAYLSREEFLERAQQTELSSFLDPEKRATPWDARFAYPTQRYFTEYLKAKYGAAKFQQFLERDLAQPTAWRTNFGEVFQVPFATAIADFQSALRNRSWLP